MQRFFYSIHCNLNRILTAVAFVLLCSFLWLSCRVYFADSEIWSISLSGQTFNFQTANFSILSKASFNLLLSSIYLFPFNNDQHFLFSRLIFGFIGLLNCYLTFVLGKRIFRNSVVAILAVILVVTTTAFMVRGFRVRADVLSLTFSLLFAIRTLNFFESNIRDQWRAYAIQLFCFFCLLMSATPKAVYLLIWNLCFALALSFSLPIQTRKYFRKAYIYGILVPIGLGIFFLVLSTIYSRLGGNNRLYAAYYVAWLFFYNALVTWDFTNFATEKLYFFVRFLRENFFFLLLAIIPIFSAVVEMICTKVMTRGRAFRLATLVYLISVFTYNDILPFFIATWVPILAISAAQYLFSIPKILGRAINRSAPEIMYVRTILILLLVGFYSVKGGELVWLNLTENSNRKQRELISVLTDYLRSFPNSTFYDVIGLLPRRNTIYKFAGPGQEAQNRFIAQFIIENKPDFIFYVRKASFLEPDLSKFLAGEYADIGSGAHARGVTFYEKGSFGRKLREVALRREYHYNKEYWVVSSDVIADAIEALHEDIYKHKAYFYVETKSGSVQRDTVFFKRGDKKIYGLGIGAMDPNEWIQAGEFFISTEVEKISITKFPPMGIPIGYNFYFNFAYDTMF